MSNQEQYSMNKKTTKLSIDMLQRSLSDLSLHLSKEAASNITKLPLISEVECAKCECCGMSEECTQEYITSIRNKFSDKLICGLCGEAVKEQMEKKGGKIEEALNEHMGDCARFNGFGRAYPGLYQAQAMREIFKRNGLKSKSISSRDIKSGFGVKKGGISRSLSCIPAITHED